MIHLFVKVCILIAAYKWGDWRNWQVYYPTILFMIVVDLFYNFTFYQYPMWSIHEGKIPILQYDYFVILSFMLLRYPPTILIYLGRFPNGLFKSVLWIGFWVALYSSLEAVELRLNLISHHNGWHMGWSILFNIVMFILLKVHFHRPIIAWGLSISWIFTLWTLLDVPLTILKDGTP